jgi:hypothetical protein
LILCTEFDTFSGDYIWYSIPVNFNGIVRNFRNLIMKGILDGHWNRRLYWMGGHGLFESQEASQNMAEHKVNVAGRNFQ